MITPVADEQVPVLVPGWRPPLLQLVLAVLVTVGVLLGLPWLWVAVGITQLFLVISWHHALGTPDLRVGATLAGVLIVAADIAVGWYADTTYYGPIVVVVAVGFLLAVVQQLARRDGRGDLTLSLASTLGLALVGGFGAGWVVNLRLDQGDDLTVLTGVAVAAAAAGRLAPGLFGAAAALVLGTAAAAIVGADTTGVGAALGGVVGGAAVLPSVLAAIVQVRGGVRLAGWPVGATWPILLAPGLAYLVLRIAGH
jgi:hypothetical protein